jgi:predicted dehydrogenase
MGMRGTFVKDYPVPDDNAIIIAKYKHAFGVAEASWTQVTGYAGANPIAYGTLGSLAVSQGKILLSRPGHETETITPPELIYPYRSGPEYLLYCIESQAPIEGLCSPIVSRDAQEILDAGLRSADEGATITLPH